MAFATARLDDPGFASTLMAWIDGLVDELARSKGQCDMLRLARVGAASATVQHLGGYARNLVGALTLWGDLADLLSPEGHDLKQGKRTVPLAAHVNALPASERPAFLARLEAARTSEAEREALREELRVSPAAAAATVYRNLDLAMAKVALSRAGVPNPGRPASFVEALAGLD